MHRKSKLPSNMLRSKKNKTSFRFTDGHNTTEYVKMKT